MHHVILHLSLIPSVAHRVISALVEHGARTGYTLDHLYALSHADFAAIPGISISMAHKLVAGLRDTRLIDDEIALLKSHEINFVTIFDSDYPEQLKHIAQPPPILYWHGKPLKNYTKLLAVVGSRKVNLYGERVLKAMVPVLSSAGWCIVSGGALGVDALAHEQAIAAGGDTIAVLGSGLLAPSPRTNCKLFEAIAAQHGTVVSPFPLRMGALPGNFPARNRIIAGLSRGTVVIQAAEKSGARITANYALDQGREVFAVPGAVDDPLSVGCHQLIQQGAKLVASADDILSEFGEVGVAALQLSIDVSKGDTSALGGVENAILSCCRTGVSFDDLLSQVSVSEEVLREKLFELSLEGHVAQDFMGQWITTNSRS